MELNRLFAEYQPGDEWPWSDEFNHLQEIHADQLAALTESIRTDGIRNPITLGNDKRVWDGHHRLLVARNLGLEEVPVEQAGEPLVVPRVR